MQPHKQRKDVYGPGLQRFKTPHQQDSYTPSQNQAASIK